MYENAKNALRKAIKDFFSETEIFDPAYMKEAADKFVYEHDQEILDHFRDNQNLDDMFEDILEEFDFYDIW